MSALLSKRPVPERACIATSMILFVSSYPRYPLRRDPVAQVDHALDKLRDVRTLLHSALVRSASLEAGEDVRAEQFCVPEQHDCQNN